MASWDDEDFDPDQGFQQPAAAVSDRWDGEDEDDDVKASWEDDDEEDKEGSGDNGTKVKAVQRKKKKKLEDIIKEKEEKARKEMEERQKAETKLTPEEEAEERLRRQHLQEESDLQLAKEAFGVSDDGRVTIDSMNPKTEEDFKEFGKVLKDKILQFEQSDHYVNFLDELFQACSLDLDAEHVKKLGTSLTAIAQEKTKAQKAVQKKKKTKKAVLAGSGKSGRNGDLDAYNMGGELDDFM